MTMTLEKLIKNWVRVVFLVAVGSNLAWAELRFANLKTAIEKQADVVKDISDIKSRMAVNETIDRLREQSINESFLRIENAQNNLTTQMNQLIWMQLDKETD